MGFGSWIAKYGIWPRSISLSLFLVLFGDEDLRLGCVSDEDERVGYVDDEHMLIGGYAVWLDREIRFLVPVGLAWSLVLSLSQSFPIPVLVDRPCVQAGVDLAVRILPSFYCIPWSVGRVSRFVPSRSVEGPYLHPRPQVCPLPAIRYSYAPSSLRSLHPSIAFH
ncbi:hypothetical protein M422DRAFT_267690 [Sphaerobolus stellatus SS14]|uniref:Uncharacterized protein n=1 Tax=Sphaerobolus stellatus (strain SS14) TaxID=990650 RepID=A0A0C9U8H3_SPHS4|nr:hypothetical protein M422DRAFT_267690 [Sphaerobolus stellatus SS14]